MKCSIYTLTDNIASGKETVVASHFNGVTMRDLLSLVVDERSILRWKTRFCKNVEERKLR